jgi:hypothetical protein
MKDMTKVLKPFNGRTLKIYGAAMMAGLTMFGALAIVNFFTVNYANTGIEVVGNNNQITLVPSTGVQGFPVAVFCEDPATVVSVGHAPDASGLTYTLVRDQNGVFESVIVIVSGEITTGTHYSDSPDGQVAQPANVDDEAMVCISDRL